MAKNKEKRFLVTYTQNSFTGPYFQILVDKETGVNYIYAASGYSGGITPLLNSDGTPVITPVSETCE